MQDHCILAFACSWTLAHHLVFSLSFSNFTTPWTSIHPQLIFLPGIADQIPWDTEALFDRLSLDGLLWAETLSWFSNFRDLQAICCILLMSVLHILWSLLSCLIWYGIRKDWSYFWVESEQYLRCTNLLPQCQLCSLQMHLFSPKNLHTSRLSPPQQYL